MGTRKDSGASAARNYKLTALNADAPCGLFEASSGNKYIVGDDCECKFAVVLEHPLWRPFTLKVLSDKVLEHGKPRGGYQLRLTHAVAGTDSRKTNKPWAIDPADEKPGFLGIGDRCAMIHCRRNKHDKWWMPLGCVTETEFCDYDGWSIVAMDGKTFFEKVVPGQRPTELLEVLDYRPMVPGEGAVARKKSVSR